MCSQANCISFDCLYFMYANHFSAKAYHQLEWSSWKGLIRNVLSFTPTMRAGRRKILWVPISCCNYKVNVTGVRYTILSLSVSLGRWLFQFELVRVGLRIPMYISWINTRPVFALHVLTIDMMWLICYVNISPLIWVFFLNCFGFHTVLSVSQ